MAPISTSFTDARGVAVSADAAHVAGSSTIVLSAVAVCCGNPEDYQQYCDSFPILFLTEEPSFAAPVWHGWDPRR